MIDARPQPHDGDEDPLCLASTAQNLGVVHAEKGDRGLTDAERATRRYRSARDGSDDSRSGVLPAGRGSAADRRGDGRRVGASLTFLSEGPQRPGGNRPLMARVGSVDCWAGSAGAMMWTGPGRESAGAWAAFMADVASGCNVAWRRPRLAGTVHDFPNCQIGVASGQREPSATRPAVWALAAALN